MQIRVLVVVLAMLSEQALAQQYTFKHFAGTEPGLGIGDATGPDANFALPYGLARDTAGNLYVSDMRTFTIRKITASGAVTTFAGLAWEGGYTEGFRGSARFYSPRHVALDAGGNLYVADAGTHLIYRITPAGLMSTFAGTPYISGAANGPRLSATFNVPWGIAVGPTGIVYVTERGNHTIRKIEAGVVSTLAGSVGVAGSMDATGTSATFRGPQGIAAASDGSVYVGDSDNYTIRHITPGGVVTTLAGLAGSAGDTDGTGSAARFFAMEGLAMGPSGDIFVSDSHRLRRVTPGGVVTTIAGQTTFGHVDANGTSARFSVLAGIAVDPTGVVYAAERFGNTIRRVSASADVTTLAGKPLETGADDLTGSSARFNRPHGMAMNGTNIVVADRGNATIRSITPAGATTTIAGTAGTSGSANGNGADARFSDPTGVAVDASGNIFVAEVYAHTIRKIEPDGDVTTFAGTPFVSGSTNTVDGSPLFNQPADIAIDGAGNLYVADSGNHTIRKITPAGVVSTFAGAAGVSGTTNATGTNARFNMPLGIEFDGAGNLFVADRSNAAIRKIVISTAAVTTFAGVAGSINTPIDGTGTAARFYDPTGIALGTGGNLFVTEPQASVVRKITSGAVVTTVAGRAFKYCDDDGTGDDARFSSVYGVAVDGSGNVFVSNVESSVIDRGAVAHVAEATIDSATGIVHVIRQLGTSVAGSTYSWDVVRRPSGSTAALSSATLRNPTFVPDVPDVYTFRLTMTGGGATSITMVSLSATCATLTVSPAALSGAIVGTSFPRTITATGGTPPYTYAVTGGTLPPGLTLSPGGNLTGTPTTAGTYNFIVRATDTYLCTGDRSYSLVVHPFAAPVNFVATANGTSSVSLTWNALAGAAGYRVYRRSAPGGFSLVASPAGNSFSDTTVAGNQAYQYRVLGHDGAGHDSPDSDPDFAVTIAYTDPTITTGVTTVKAVHFQQLRSAVNLLRALAGQSAFAFTDAALAGIVIKELHVTELQTTIASVRTALGELGLLWSVDPVVEATHLDLLRSSVK